MAQLMWRLGPFTQTPYLGSLEARYSQLLTLSNILCRYYYDKNIILKTAGKRYVYRFVCDLQGLLGYSPEEIHQMVDLKLEKKEED